MGRWRERVGQRPFDGCIHVIVSALEASNHQADAIEWSLNLTHEKESIQPVINIPYQVIGAMRKQKLCRTLLELVECPLLVKYFRVV